MTSGSRPGSAPIPVLETLSSAERAVARALGNQWLTTGQEIMLVGGVVRDALLGERGSNDLDFATSTLPPETRELASAAGATSLYLPGERFGTVGAVFGEGQDAVLAEITSYRSEQYLDDTRFPEVQFGATLEDDLARRDFTINAIAANPISGDLFDPYQGQADLALGVLRAVGNPAERFAEDPLRLLRAARFVARLGFRVDPATASAMREQAPSLARISQERIYGELTRLLLGPFAGHGLELLRQTGILEQVLPELVPLAAYAERGNGRWPREKDLWAHTLQVVDQSPPRPSVRWAALLHDAAKPRTRGVDPSGEVHFFGHERAGASIARQVLTRLKAGKTMLASVPRLVEMHGRPEAYEPDWTASAVRRLALDAGDEWEDLLELAAADVTSGFEQRRRRAAARIEGLRAHFNRLQAEAELAKLQSPLDGIALMTHFQRGPGLWIKQVKDYLRDLVIDGELSPSDQETAIRLATSYLEQQSPPRE